MNILSSNFLLGSVLFTTPPPSPHCYTHVHDTPTLMLAHVQYCALNIYVRTDKFLRCTHYLDQRLLREHNSVLHLFDVLLQQLASLADRPARRSEVCDRRHMRRGERRTEERSEMERKEKSQKMEEIEDKEMLVPKSSSIHKIWT